MKVRSIAFTLAVLLFVGGVGTGWVLRSDNSSILEGSFFTFSNVRLSLVEEVWNKLHEQYVDREDLDDTTLIFGAIKGMLQSLEDPFTVFFDPEQTKTFLSSVNGTFDGIGAEIEVQDEKLLIVAPLKDTPADRAGLRPKDYILEINGEDTIGITVEGAVSKIRGEKGTTVILLISRDNEDPFPVSIKRGTIHIPSLRWELNDEVAIISFFSFTSNSSADFKKAAKEIHESSARGVILDLRSNPGGFLDESIEIAGIFLSNDTLVLREVLGAGEEKEYRTRRTGLLENLPIVVLVDGGSASASEIVAGALRDQRGILIIGEKTFGKGSVQSFEELPGGASFKYTIARWLTPNGTSIQDEGIIPDIIAVFDPDAEEDTQIQKAQEILEEILN